MNTVCQVYAFDFPKPNSLTEFLFSPRIVTMQQGSITERMQRWLIDNGSFYSRGSKYLNQRILQIGDEKPIFTQQDVNTLYGFLDSFLLVESMAGRFFYMSVTSMLLRSIELFSQSAKNSLNASALHAKIKTILDSLIMPAIVAFTLYLGYDSQDLILLVLIPALLEKALSFTWSNYFRQINTLSSTKDFQLNDFIFKNIQIFFVRMIIPILVLYTHRLYQPAWMIFCKSNTGEVSVGNFETASYRIEDIVLEPIALMLGKMFFDLSYILMLKRFAKDVDLRDPMGWMFSKFRKKVVSPKKYFPKPKSCNLKKVRISDTRPQKQSPKPKEVLPIEIPTPKASSNLSVKHNENEQSKPKVKTTGKAYFVPQTRKSPTEIVQTSINIEVGGFVRTFEKIESSSFNEAVWGVIIADYVENQKLTKYERLLSNATIGGGIRQLKGGCYEIGATMDSRLIGKMYHNGVYNSLQNFMRLEDALHVSQELEMHGIPDNIGLIVFSAEAKTHDDIARVANKL